MIGRVSCTFALLIPPLWRTNSVSRRCRCEVKTDPLLTISLNTPPIDTSFAVSSARRAAVSQPASDLWHSLGSDSEFLSFRIWNALTALISFLAVDDPVYFWEVSRGYCRKRHVEESGQRLLKIRDRSSGGSGARHSILKPVTS